MAQGRRNWLNTLFLWGTLLAAAVALPLHLALNGWNWTEWIVSLAMVFIIGTAISAGYHRLFSHRAYRATAPWRALMLFFGAASFENSALKWSSDHRIHHRHVDDLEKDPYAIGNGFAWAHWDWVMKGPDIPLQGVEDLKKDPMVQFQHDHVFAVGAVAASIPLVIGLATGNFWGHLVVGLLVRIVLTHHTTFLINSAAHVFGSRPYTEENSARDNWLLAPLTYGEGYHNFHHMWQWDYRNGAKWWQYDSTKWILNALRPTGMVYDFRRVPAAVMRRAELAVEAQRLQAKLVARKAEGVESLHDRLASARARMDAAIANLHERRESWGRKRRELKVLGRAKAEAFRMAKAEWQEGMIRHKAELAEAWAEWKAARRAVLAVA
ncbi:MAG TPA: acyl-CoA desaturase [Holophagaceae bacterium]|nr:acyl-CoA desaturase [Holophagaceae bacterium]